MNTSSGLPFSEDELMPRVVAGDSDALAQLFEIYHFQLAQAVRARMDRRIRGRVDVEDVLQESFLDASRRLCEYAMNPRCSFYYWLRLLTLQRLIDVHRQHLGAKKRTVSSEASDDARIARAEPGLSIAESIADDSSVLVDAFSRQEANRAVRLAFDALQPIDREVLTLRIFETVSNDGVARMLGLSKSAASNRYARAINHLRKAVRVCHGDCESWRPSKNMVPMPSSAA